MQFEKSRQRPLAIIALLASFLTLIAASASPNPAAVNGFLDSTWENASKVGNYEPKKYPGSLYWIGQEAVGAGEMWNDGWTGEGVDVAVIDTGVVPVAGLSGTGKVVFGPDLSFESQSPTQIHLDTNGHGTHMAGIIAGRDGTSKVQKGTEKEFLGIAPGARIVSVKVGNFEGAVDVSQVIAAIDWVVENKNANGLNIRVLNPPSAPSPISPIWSILSLMRWNALGRRGSLLLSPPATTAVPRWSGIRRPLRLSSR